MAVGYTIRKLELKHINVGVRTNSKKMNLIHCKQGLSRSMFQLAIERRYLGKAENISYTSQLKKKRSSVITVLHS